MFPNRILSMNKFIHFIILVLLVSCQQKKLDRLQYVQDSIRQVEAEKDSTVFGFVSTMNEIQQNLDSIRQIEEFVKLQTVSGSELSPDARRSILDDIKLIHQLLQKNKDLVARLQHELESSKHNITGLQKTILYLNKQVEEKDAHIGQLTTELAKLHQNIKGLSSKVKMAEANASEKEQLIAEKDLELMQQEAELNTAYYVFGTLKELIENGVIEKEGGVLGVGRSLKFRKDFNPDVFTPVDIREMTEISLLAKKVKIVSTHPAESFELTGEVKVESLVIKDVQQFWQTSKYLVIVVN